MQSPTTRQLAFEFQRIMEKLAAARDCVVALFGFLVIIPLFLWFGWRDSSALMFKLALTVFCLS